MMAADMIELLAGVVIRLRAILTHASHANCLYSRVRYYEIQIGLC